MKSAFVSYVGDDRAAATRLAQDLTRNSIEVWIDTRNLEAGYRWVDGIRKGIREADYFLACFSSNYYVRDTSFMRDEIDYAIQSLVKMQKSGGWLIPLRLDICEIPPIPINNDETINALQWVDLFPDWDSGIRKLLKVIEPNSVELTVERRVEEVINSKTTELRLEGLGIRTLPSCVTKTATHVQRLYVANNNLESLPEWFGVFRNLTHLDLANNRFASFPKEICLCTALEYLVLDGNSYIKTLPEEIMHLKHLHTMHCHGMNLESLPQCIFQMADRNKLKWLYLEDELSLEICEDAVDSADALNIAISWSNSPKKKRLTKR